MVGAVGSVGVALGAGVKVERPVIFLSFRGGAERGVGVGDGDEAGGGFRIVGITVGVVGFGEGVEGFLHLSRRSFRRYL